MWMERVGPSILAMHRREGKPLPTNATPPPYGDHPEIEDWIMAAFADLSTDRSIGFATGPIPWTAIAAYADGAGLDREASKTFVGYIRALDRAYLADRSAQEPKPS